MKWFLATLLTAFGCNVCRAQCDSIELDVRIELPYPQALTDNIDSWVLWATKNMK